MLIDTKEAHEETQEGKPLCGIDEAGRGCLAGPLVVAGVVLHKNIKGLNDSKKLTPKKREELFNDIIKNSSFKIIFTDNKTIDKTGLSTALKNSLLSIKKRFANCDILMDGNTAFGVEGIRYLVKADSKIPEVSAASILAKVARDRYMCKIATKYPLYNFCKHKGYGTKEHIDIIKKIGYSKIHRRSFSIKTFKQPSLFE